MMSDQKNHLPNAYKIENTEQAKEFYKDWADTYEAEISDNVYSTPDRCAKALADFSDDLSGATLDIGCGTGLSGQALRATGFTTLDGSDLSAEMLEKAHMREGLYRNLWVADLDNGFPFEPGAYSHIAAIGVIAGSHAPAKTIDEVLAVLAKDGLFVFSLNDHTIKDPEFEARVAENLDTGMARLLFKEHGPHLDKLGMGSTVYVMQKV
ncbi:MAG: putative TPR repeat methyltransferase [Paracoccaceae bacterium]|jgi:predicted TPR repeat methyltransferase